MDKFLTVYLTSGRKIDLECQENQTRVTNVLSSYGQQQQSSCSFQTGDWLSTPEVTQTQDGLTVKINASLGVHYVQIEGSSISCSKQDSPPSEALPMKHLPPISPMPPMPPLKMGNMTMDINKMEMRMGNMELKMDNRASAKAQFCTQCGAALKLGDRFCSQCGYHLE